MIEIRLIEHALAVADEASFAVAAQALGISQPALSRSIQSLEAQLGVQLFERSHRRIEPTNAGRVFLQRGRELAMQHAQLAEEMGLLRSGEHPTLSLAVGPYVAELVAAPAIASMMMEHPQVQFRMRVEGWADAVKFVRAREVDLAVADCSQLTDDADLEVTSLGKNQGFLAVRKGHPLLRNRTCTVDQALAFPVVSTGRLPPRILAPLVQERGNGSAHKDSGFPTIVCEQVSVMREIVARSDAVGMFLLSLIERELEAGLLVPLPCQLPWLHSQFGIIRRKNRSLSATASALIQRIEQAAAALAGKDEKLIQKFSPANNAA